MSYPDFKKQYGVNGKIPLAYISQQGEPLDLTFEKEKKKKLSDINENIKQRLFYLQTDAIARQIRVKMIENMAEFYLAHPTPTYQLISVPQFSRFYKIGGRFQVLIYST